MNDVRMAEEKKETIHEDMKKLLEQNIELSKKVLKLSKKNHNILKWQYFFGFLKIILIVIPLILGIIYLPPFLEKILDSYQGFLGLNEKVESINPANIDLNKVTPEFLKKLKK